MNEQMTEEEYKQFLKEADIAERFLESEMGRIIKEMCSRIVERVIFEQATCPMEEFIKLENQISWRMALKFYKYDLLGTVNRLKEQGFIVYQERKSGTSPEFEGSLNTAEKGEYDG